MFDHFTFGVQPHARYLQDEVSASPTDTSFISKSKQNPSTLPKECPFPDLPAIDEIVDRFTDYTLRPKESSSAATQPTSRADATTESSTTFDYTTMSFVSTRKGLTDVVRNTSASIPSPTSHSSSFSPSSGSDVGCKRLQRQLNTQLQTCTNHIKDITSLVENMISTSSQCRLHSPSSLRPSRSRSSSPSHIIGSSMDDLIVDEEMSDGDGLAAYVPVVVDPNEDEGFAEMDDDDDLEITLRRVSTPIGIRKYGSAHSPVFSKYGSMGAGLNAYMPREKHKIRSVPRLRRRKPLNTAMEE